MTTPRHLILIRHAKAEPYASTDFERLLTDRGVRDAEAVGRYLAGSGRVPDYALVSPAARTRATWQAVARELGAEVPTVEDRALYQGGPDAVLEALATVPQDVRTVVVVGHNPTIADLALLLEDGQGDEAAHQQLIVGYPPAALAVFEVGGGWDGLGPEAGRLVDFHVGHGTKDRSTRR